MSRESDEEKLEGVVAGKLRGWLARAREAVMAPWRQYRTAPDPSAVYNLQGDWDAAVDSILTVIGNIAMGAWSQATDVPPVSRHSFIVAYLADVRSLLVRIPDEVANLVFAEINDAINAGADNDEVARRVDQVLSYTGSERWPGRARTIAVTEVTRAYGAGTMAAGLEQSRVTGRMLRKRWATERDTRVREAHEQANGQTVGLTMPFQVGGEMLQFPGDPSGSPDNVIGCRCDLIIVNERGQS